jgi:hypothetical protein
MFEVADDIVLREDEILALGRDGLLVRRTHSGFDRSGGGAYERVFINLSIFGADGLSTRGEYFDADRDAEALARFDELTTASRPVRIETAATRVEDRYRDAWAARDWKRFAALFPPGHRLIERRRMVQLEIDRERFLETLRPYFEMTSSFTSEVLATRGNRLALSRSVWMGGDSESGRARSSGSGSWRWTATAGPLSWSRSTPTTRRRLRRAPTRATPPAKPPPTLATRGRCSASRRPVP